MCWLSRRTSRSPACVVHVPTSRRLRTHRRLCALPHIWLGSATLAWTRLGKRCSSVDVVLAHPPWYRQPVVLHKPDGWPLFTLTPTISFETQTKACAVMACRSETQGCIPHRMLLTRVNMFWASAGWDHNASSYTIMTLYWNHVMFAFRVILFLAIQAACANVILSRTSQKYEHEH